MPIPFARRKRRRCGIVTPPGRGGSVDADGRPRPAMVAEGSSLEAMDDPGRWDTESGFFGLAETPAPATKPWQDAIAAIVPAAISLAQQRQLTRLQTARTQAGLPLLTAEEIRANIPPAARIEHSLPPVNWRSLALPIGVGLAGLVGISMWMARRDRRGRSSRR